MGSAERVPMTYLQQMQTTFNPPLIANENAFLGDVATSEKTDDEKPITSDSFGLRKVLIHTLSSTPLVYEYTYHEMKIILEGHFYISDGTGKEVKATKGDVFYFPAGSKMTFKTDDYGLAFYTGQRKEGGA